MHDGNKIKNYCKLIAFYAVQRGAQKMYNNKRSIVKKYCTDEKKHINYSCLEEKYG